MRTILDLDSESERLDAEKPYGELIDGVEIRKDAPMMRHSLLQGAMLRLIEDLGCRARICGTRMPHLVGRRCRATDVRSCPTLRTFARGVWKRYARARAAAATARTGSRGRDSFAGRSGTQHRAQDGAVPRSRRIARARRGSRCGGRSSTHDGVTRNGASTRVTSSQHEAFPGLTFDVAAFFRERRHRSSLSRPTREAARRHLSGESRGSPTSGHAIASVGSFQRIARSRFASCIAPCL